MAEVISFRTLRVCNPCGDARFPTSSTSAPSSLYARLNWKYISGNGFPRSLSADETPLWYLWYLSWGRVDFICIYFVWDLLFCPLKDIDNFLYTSPRDCQFYVQFIQLKWKETAQLVKTREEHLRSLHLKHIGYLWHAYSFSSCTTNRLQDAWKHRWSSKKLSQRISLCIEVP
jgi:hypothetical protein